MSRLLRHGACVVCLPMIVHFFGCDQGAGGRCLRDADCAPAERCADGICSHLLEHDRGVAEASATDLSSDRRRDAGSIVDGAVDAITCRGNGDRRIDRRELPMVVGASARYQVGTGLTVDLRGVMSKKTRVWRLKAAARDDHVVVATLQPVFGWARASFPNATYAALLDEGLDSYGVFSARADALVLDGVISKQPNKTRLRYDTPVLMLRFPIRASGVSSSASNVSGTLNHLPVWLHERYEIISRGAGRLELPDITFDVILVQLRVEQASLTAPLLRVERSTFMFVAECYGVVARLLVDGPLSDLSSVRARERWRLSF